MNFSSFLIPVDMVAEYTVKVDSCNEIRPIPIQDGSDAGMFYLDEAILVRFPQLKDKLEDGKRSVKIKKKVLDSSKLSKKMGKLKID